MYLSRLTFTVSEPIVLRAFGDLHAMHRLLLQGFPDHRKGGTGRVLFRVDSPRTSRDVPSALVQSELRPDWGRLSNLAQIEGPKDWQPAFSTGQILRFRLYATPTVKREFGAGAARPGHRRVGLHTEPEQRDWLTRKAESNGFAILQVELRSLGRLSGNSPRDGQITHTGVDFDGVLQVTDPAAFQSAVVSGIGSGKAFGFGLLSVARAG